MNESQKNKSITKKCSLKKIILIGVKSFFLLVIISYCFAHVCCNTIKNTKTEIKNVGNSTVDTTTITEQGNKLDVLEIILLITAVLIFLIPFENIESIDVSSTGVKLNLKEKIDEISHLQIEQLAEIKKIVDQIRLSGVGFDQLNHLKRLNAGTFRITKIIGNFKEQLKSLFNIGYIYINEQKVILEEGDKQPPFYSAWEAFKKALEKNNSVNLNQFFSITENGKNYLEEVASS